MVIKIRTKKIVRIINDEEYEYKTMKGPLQCAPNTGPRMHSGQNIYMIHAWYFVKLVVKMDDVKRFVDLQ